ncbi:MAG: GTP-binding protein [Rhodospirillaceae bacterium]|jgi:G3E family GTPase|nr:GTP-binding protein [Rhodospirillaceae bacterium]MBT5944190.1 GTP-binding protein [Rhodospirillaceae bacterium]MBT6405858.1 GTP-binding protein [Rhodospirillaceae bacterium]MBT6536548.1 GTP-binding protein [Rhodospirillaceae bacterium]MBT7362122.1 GTP-binding protein [Rhodospirillaceae bacterium]
MSEKEPEMAAELIPVSLLTGFLGSGKTTVLNHVLHDPRMDKAAVIVNEFGEVGLDHELMVAGAEDMVLLNSGCLCCTVRGDLVNTLRDMMMLRLREDVPSFDRVLIETTGLADPAPILHTLMSDQLVTNYFRLDGVITTVDAANGADTLDKQFESVKQVAVADRLLLTKTDIADAATLEALEERLAAANPAAPRITVLDGDVDPAMLFNAGLYDPKTKTPDVEGWLRDEAYADGAGNGDDHEHGHGDHDHGHDVNRHDDHISSFCVTYDKPLRLDALEQWFDTIMMLKGPDLLRIKGIVNVAEMDRPVVIHGVQHVFHPPAVLDAWPSDDRRTRIVFITRDVERKTIEDTLTWFSDEKLRDQKNPGAGLMGDSAK